MLGAEEHELGTHKLEEGPPQMQGEAGRRGSTLLGHQGVPQAENLLGDLVSKSLLHGRTGGRQKHEQWATRELGGPC